MEYQTYFIEAINEYRIENNLNLSQFAKHMGITEQCVSRWIKEKNAPSLEYLILVANELNCSLDYLVGRSQYPQYIPAKNFSSFNERLDLLLKRNHLSSYRLAKNCGFGDNIFAKWKKGKIPKPETLILIADYFNVSLDYLVGRSDSI